jgi:hypothetical protein
MSGESTHLFDTDLSPAQAVEDLEALGYVMSADWPQWHIPVHCGTRWARLGACSSAA